MSEPYFNLLQTIQSELVSPYTTSAPPECVRHLKKESFSHCIPDDLDVIDCRVL